MGLKTTFLQHVLTPAVLACAGGWWGQSRWKPGGCGGAASSFQKRSSSIRTRSPRRSNQWIHQQTWTLQRKNPSPQSLWHPQRWPGALWCVDKGKARLVCIEIKTVILTQSNLDKVVTLHWCQILHWETWLIEVIYSCFQDRGATSTWEITQGKPSERRQSVQNKDQETSSWDPLQPLRLTLNLKLWGLNLTLSTQRLQENWRPNHHETDNRTKAWCACHQCMNSRTPCFIKEKLAYWRLTSVGIMQ